MFFFSLILYFKFCYFYLISYLVFPTGEFYSGKGPAGGFIAERGVDCAKFHTVR